MSTGKGERYWDKRGKDARSYDTIVIGSGMGGMTCAATLASFGERVLVLEQHYVPGGFTHMFSRPGYEWDVGVHAVGEVTEHSMTGRLLKRLTGGRLKWASLGDVYDEFYFPDDFRIDFPNTPKQFNENLYAAFPSERAAIGAYMKTVDQVAGAMKGYYLARTLPHWADRLTDVTVARRAHRHLTSLTADVMGKITGNERLKTVLVSQWGYYGSVPSRSAFAIQALVTKHFKWGGYYPVGGAGEIARQLLKTVADAGGWTRVSTSVEQIVIDKGKAVGVRLAKTGEVIRAKRVISAAGIMSTAARLLPPEYLAKPWVKSVAKLNPAAAHLCLYIGFKGDIRGAGASSANKWFYNTWDSNVPGWNVDDSSALKDAPILYCSFPSLKDPSHAPGPEQRHTGEVVTFVPWQNFEAWQGSRWRKRGDDYGAYKAALKERLLQQFLRNMPGLRDMVDVVELSTPVSTDHFTRPMKGSIYGIEPTPERYRNPWLRPRSPIGNLYFAGSEVVSVGVIGAMMGGVMGAMAAEPVKAFNLIRKVT